MKRAIAPIVFLGASILLNALMLGIVGWNLHLVDSTPQGQVLVTQLDGPGDELLARAGM
ncbi:MAG TPA: hypothetical protein VGN07_11140 [Steroidobacteraceae bacterium]|jgi:hypothetical protein